MIAFNTNFIFSNASEETQIASIDKSLDTVFILEKEDLKSQTLHPIKSPWITMSGKKVRYYSHKYFDEFHTLEDWSLEIKDTIFLSWHSQEKEILYQKGALYSNNILHFWIFHTFFPLIMELEKKCKMFHVGAVEVNQKSILFSAQSFGGKSTLTKYFLEQSHALLSDDSLAIISQNDTYFAIPSYPFNRPNRKLETLGNPISNFAEGIKPIHAIYVLEKGLPDDKITITPLKGIEKYKAFHFSSFIDFFFKKEEKFIFFIEMAQKIPVYQINIPWKLTRLKDVYETIIKHIEENSQSLQ